MKVSRALGCGSLLMLVAACGGGGTDGGSGSDFRVTLDRSSIQFSLTEGESPGPIWISASTSGTPPATVYVRAVVAGEGIDPNVLLDSSGPAPRIGVYPAAGLAPATYTGTVKLYVCSDAGCAHPIGGTPLPVSYTVVVKRSFKVTPTFLSLAAVSGDAASASLHVQLPDGATAFGAAVTVSAPWLQLTQANATELQVTAASWRAGFYSTWIELTANGEHLNVSVQYTVTAPPGGEHGLSVAPQQLAFATTENAAAPAQALTITLPTWGSSTDVQITTQYGGGAAGWLTATRTPGGADVVASAAALPAGTYTASLTFTPSAPGWPVTVPVSLTVGPGLVRPADASLGVDVESVAAALTGAAPVDVVAGPPIAWTASSSATWLSVTPSGLTGTSLSYAVDAALLEGLQNFADHRATVTITPVPTHVTPVSFDVVVREALPEVHFVGPYLLVAGRPARVYVRGRGFATKPSSVLSGLTVEGLEPDGAVTVVNDTELVMQLTPPAAAEHLVSISNALGFATGAARLEVVLPQTYDYAAIPTSGNKRTIVFDAERRAVYAVNVGTDALTRFRFDGAAWSTDSVPVPAILDAGLGPDGSTLVVTATPGTLRLLDPGTLATQFTLTTSRGFPRHLTYVALGIGASNDGRSWLVLGGSEDLAFFDHRTRTLQPRPPQSLRTSFYGPLTAMARAGERMVISQSSGLTPQPPMLYLDARDSLLVETPATPAAFSDAQLSDDGDRVLFSQSVVRDGSFALVGRTTLPPDPLYYYARAGAMSPDGTRAYVLAYPTETARTALPRVYVFDSSVASPSGELPLLGTFELQHYPTCRDYTACSTTPRAAISPDGATLFFVGDTNLVVAPVPSFP